MKKDFWIDSFIQSKNYFDKGWNTFSFLRNIVTGGGVLVGIAHFEALKQNALLLGLIFTAYCVFCYWFGWWWDTKRYYHRETEWSNVRNPSLQKILENGKKT